MTALARPCPDLILVAALSLLASAFTLKAMRYVDEHPEAPAAAMQRIEQRLATEGWSRTATDVFPEGMPLFAAHFAKPGCPATTITILGRKSELTHYVAGTHDGDVVFVPPEQSQTGALHAGILDRFRLSSRDTLVTKPLPLLAIAPRSRPSACALSIAG